MNSARAWRERAGIAPTSLSGKSKEDLLALRAGGRLIGGRAVRCKREGTQGALWSPLRLS